MKFLILVLLTPLIVGVAGWLVYSQFTQTYSIQNPPVPTDQTQTSTNTTTNSSEVLVPYHVEEVVSDLVVPWSLAFTSPNRILVSERDGQIRLVENGQLRDEPMYVINDISTQSEEGLMGLALDPDYATNNYIYACYAYPEGNTLYDRVIRLVDQGDQLSLDQIIIDNIPAARFHAGCELAFGPDNKLYITTGDATDKDLPQDLNSLGGKILRLNPDGSIPTDNPFANSPIYTLGHRNPQGLDWHPDTNALVATEHGPSGNDGPPGGDEINLIQAGQNYGWPIVSHQETKPEFVDPLIVYTPAEAPGSGMFYSGEDFPQFYGDYFFGALRGEGLFHLQLNQDQTAVLESNQLELGLGRIREVIQSPDGFIYFTTSNRDGRGAAQPGDDKIYRLVPQN